LCSLAQLCLHTLVNRPPFANLQQYHDFLISAAGNMTEGVSRRYALYVPVSA